MYFSPVLIWTPFEEEVNCLSVRHHVKGDVLHNSSLFKITFFNSTQDSVWSQQFSKKFTVQAK